MRQQDSQGDSQGRARLENCTRLEITSCLNFQWEPWLLLTSALASDMEEIIFRTKSGFCHLFPDKIVLTRDGVVGNLSNFVVGSNISRILFVYTLIAVGYIY